MYNMVSRDASASKNRSVNSVLELENHYKYPINFVLYRDLLNFLGRANLGWYLVNPHVQPRQFRICIARGGRGC